MKPLEVHLRYFSLRGRQLGVGFYRTEKEMMYGIIEEVEEMRNNNTLPQGVGVTPCHILIDVPNHEINQPYLLVHHHKESTSGTN
jgi:hypothetical protein